MPHTHEDGRVTDAAVAAFWGLGEDEQPEEGEDSWAGTSSSESDEKPSNSDEPKRHKGRSRAHKTGSH
jgi:hypothetical protein